MFLGLHLTKKVNSVALPVLVLFAFLSLVMSKEKRSSRRTSEGMN